MTKRQRDLLKFIKAYVYENGGVSPTVEEMAVGIGLSIKSKAAISDMIACLESEGLIERQFNKARTVYLTQKGMER